MFKLFQYCIRRKLNRILKLKLTTLNEIISHLLHIYSFVANFVCYIFAKYYLNWFSFHVVIMKVTRGELFVDHSSPIWHVFYGLVHAE